ncbi:putative reverse transcriptase domain-containing protein [Tanacetum coccineum]
MGDLDPYAQSEITTMTVCVLQSATNATNLATSPVTVGVREMPTTLTTRRAPDRVRGLLVLSAEFSDTSRRNVQGRRTTKATVVIKMGKTLLQQKYMRSFVSTAFSSQMDIMPSTLDHYYDVELADGRIIGLNTILRGCTLNLLNHPFNINLMPVELGSFDAIIGMDWLAKYKAIIVCAEKIVRIPWGNETLIVHGDESNQGHETRLHIISYSKTQEYMLKGCPVFLAHVTTNEVEDKSEKKRLEDVPIV